MQYCQKKKRRKKIEFNPLFNPLMSGIAFGSSRHCFSKCFISDLYLRRLCDIVSLSTSHIWNISLRDSFGVSVILWRISSMYIYLCVPSFVSRNKVLCKKRNLSMEPRTKGRKGLTILAHRTNTVDIWSRFYRALYRLYRNSPEASLPASYRRRWDLFSWVTLHPVNIALPWTRRVKV